MLTIKGGFENARRQSVQHMTACDRAGLRWSETAISEIVTSRAARAATVVPFSQRAEAVSGADWVWWWVDETAAYGMLVQAKRLKITAGRWKFSFGYRNEWQRSRLMSVSESLGLVPVYALYLGTGSYRSWDPCPDDHQPRRCIACVKRSVSLMPALLADGIYVVDAASTYARSIALEELWTPSATRTRLIPLLWSQVAPEFLEYLNTPQSGARAVSRSMIDRVLTVRAGQFGAATASTRSPSNVGDHDELGPVFQGLPSDSGHFGTPYLDHVLHPLQHAPPGYVMDIVAGTADPDRLAEEMPESVSGIVVVRLH